MIRFLFIAFLFPLIGFSQSIIITGTVADKDGLALPGANVLLYQLPDSTLKGTVTNVSGAFSLENISPGNYALKITYLGYNDFNRRLEVTNQPINIGKVTLSDNAQQLKEVQVTGKMLTATQSGDTSAFNAGAFKTNPDATAEDLLQKMPGMVVQDGKVQAQGEDVKRVLVDGKPFFGDDPSAVLKNLPADVIDKIQVFDEQSEQSKFSGFNDGNTTKTINIITKGNFKNGTFGKVYAGYGYDDKYKAGGSINSFKDDRRISILAQSNNINEQNFASDDLAGVMAGGESGRGGRGGGGRGGSSNSGDFLVSQRSGISTTNALGFNYSDKWNKKTEVTGSYFFNRSENVATQNIFREYVLLTDLGQAYTENNTSTGLNTNHRAHFRLEHEIDSFNSIRFEPRLSIQENTGFSLLSGQTERGGILLNSTNTDFTSSLYGLNFSNEMLYRHRFRKKGRTFSIKGDFGYNQNSGENNLVSENIFSDVIVADALDQFSNLDQRGLNLEGRVSYTEPISEKSGIEISHEASLSENKSDKRTFNYSSQSNEYTLQDTLLSSVFDNSYMSQAFSTGYRYNAEKFKFNIKGAYQYSELDSEQEFPYPGKTKRAFENILPSAMFRYEFTKKKNLRLFYRTGTNAPSISQLQEVVNNNNPLRLRTGNPLLLQDYQQRTFLRYSSVNTEKSTSFFAMVGGSVTNDYIGNSTFIAERDTFITPQLFLPAGTQLSRPVNLDGHYNLRSYINYSVPLDSLKSNFNINVSATLSRVPGLINDALNYANTQFYSAGVVLSSNISERIDFTVSSNSGYNIAKNTLQRNLDNIFFNQSSQVKLNWIFWKDFVIQSSLNHQLNTGLSEGFNQSFLLWNMALGKKLFKNKQGDIRLSVFDLLNQNKSITRNVTDTYIEDVETNTLQRYFMLTFTYNIRSFGTKEEPKGERP